PLAPPGKACFSALITSSVAIRPKLTACSDVVDDRSGISASLLLLGQGQRPFNVKESVQTFQIRANRATDQPEDDDAKPCLQNHPNRGLFGKEHRGRDPDRRRACVAHAAAGWLVRSG